MFKEAHTYAKGDSVRAFDTGFGRVGLLICEDYWHASTPYLLWMDGADLFICLSASPVHGMGTEGELDSAAWVDRIVQTHAGLFTNFVAHCNRTGYENGINFWGGSTIIDPDGYQIVQGPTFEEALVMAELDLAQLTRTRRRLPLLRDERLGLTLRELKRIANVSLRPLRER
jgi:predicted amidohydrolase